MGELSDSIGFSETPDGGVIVWIKKGKKSLDVQITRAEFEEALGEMNFPVPQAKAKVEPPKERRAF